MLAEKSPVNRSSRIKLQIHTDRQIDTQIQIQTDRQTQTPQQLIILQASPSFVNTDLRTFLAPFQDQCSLVHARYKFTYVTYYHVLKRQKRK